MSIYRQHKDFFNKPYLLTEEQQQQPRQVIDEFFSKNRLFEVREDLALLKNVAFTHDIDEFNEATKRANISVFFDHIEELLEAAYLLTLEGA